MLWAAIPDCASVLLIYLLDLFAWQTYVLKLAKSGEEGEKVLLLIESGVRFHTVQVRYQRHAQQQGGQKMQRAAIQSRP